MRETYRIHENKGKKTFFSTAHGGKLRFFLSDGKRIGAISLMGVSLHDDDIRKKKELTT